MDKIRLKPIGVLHSQFTQAKGTPIQPRAALGIKATVDILDEYADGLKDLEGFSHIILISYFHLAKAEKLLVTPFMDDQVRGIFSTRAPSRPNHIGLSTVRLVSIKATTLHIENVDLVDGTPILDIKPYTRQFDEEVEEIRIGWLEGKIERMKKTRDDGRFVG